MAIRITNFGGLYPRAEARALPDDGAQAARDLMPGIREFRPMGQDTTVVGNTGVDGPLTIYRLARKADGSFNTDMTTGWVVKAAQMSFVKGQINNDTTERTFATFDDGSAPPRAYDASDLVTGRQLGVPGPTEAPTLEVNVIDEFTIEERAERIEAAREYIRGGARLASQPLWRGSPSDDPVDYRPGFTHDGYVDRYFVDGEVDEEEGQQIRVFRLGSTGGANTGAMSNTYDAAHGADYYRWVLDPQLKGFYATSPSTNGVWPPWAGTNQDHWAVPFYAYGLTYVLNESLLTTHLQSMEKPGEASVTRLVTDEQIEEIIERVQEALDIKLAAATPKLNAMRAAVVTMYSMLGAGGVDQREASAAAFYAKSDVEDEIDDAIDVLADALFGMAVQAHDYVEFVGYP